MSTVMSYVQSKLLTGAGELSRQHSFTRWMSGDLSQAAVDFSRNLGLVPIYSQCSPDHVTRYIFWRPPQGALFEVRSGRTKEQFEQYDRANRDQNRHLISLHINESDVYSAAWISADHFETAKNFLAALGITPAQPVAAPLT